MIVKSEQKNKAPDEKPTVTLPGRVEKIAPSVHSSEPEKAQIEVEGADHLYRETRVENTLTDGSGQKVKMKEGAHVDVTIQAGPAETTPKKPTKRKRSYGILAACFLHPALIQWGQEEFMPRIVRCSLIQAKNAENPQSPLEKIKQVMVDKHVAMIRKAAASGAQIVCLQEIFYGPYFCAEQSTRWYEFTEPVPGGPTTQLFRSLAKELRTAIVLPVYEIESEGLYYNTAAVIAPDGSYLGKYRKTHIPHVAPGFWEKFYFRPGNLGYPVFDLGFAKIGIYICYDRHFPEGARALGLNGAEIVFNPSATVAGLSEYLWKLEQPAHAAANGYFIAALNRVGTEAPWNIGEFYGSSYFCDPRGQIIAQASRDRDEVLTADLDLDRIGEVRKTWQFFRDRRPDMYGELVKP